MTVLAGLWRFSECNQPELSQATLSMIDAQAGASAAQLGTSVLESACFGQHPRPAAFGRLLGDQASDGGAILMAVDARVDNRSELFDKLARRDDPALDDESLIFLSYRRWGAQLVDHLIGDYAIAVWDQAQQVITLIRDPTGQRPLHYRRGSDFVAFASMPQGLAFGTQRRLNATRLALFVADRPRNGPETFFQDIMSVEPAHIVRVTRDGVKSHRYWQMPTRELNYPKDEDYVAAFREQLDRATHARLRGGGSIIAAHMSAGLDSGAVAATAARLLLPSGGRVLGITSAPRLDFAGPVPRGRIADESGIAATLAGLYPNIDHLILRSAGTSPLDNLESDARLFAQPVGYPCNNVWWRDANAAASSRGASVMLTGELGNLSLSAGGLGVLADLVRTGRFGTWAREMLALRKNGPRWRGLLAASFGPWLSDNLWALLTKLSGGGRSDFPDRSSLAVLTNTPTPQADHRGPRQSEREMRWELLKLSDPGNFRKGAMLRWGIDERDPTSDRRLIEFCFSLPPSQLLGGGRTRRLARIGLSDRLPAAVLNGVRGYQYADWYETLDREGLAQFAERVATSPAAAAAIDFASVDRLIAHWPPPDWASGRTIGQYRIGLLRALSAGAFALNAAE